MQDLSFTGLELSDKAQSYIASFEALAQIALEMIFGRKS